ncbi:hypothetical protein HRI_003655500 [Hibiscus trionum]|uniref:Ninja-family protein n=1 Tax=Hibiscus trionum TaxID=183268 RepID=A0A9W7IRT2_HIBTR|nr:hypothetical protein HRI_003655500 [Hibiscus trionum]
MGEENENIRRINSSNKEYPRDFLQRFISSESQASIRSARKEDFGEEEEEEVELNLGLSLGGRFGVDKNAKKLTRASSIAGSMPTLRQDRDSPINTKPTVPYPTLIRTSSLPVETEEEWRKRKECQSLRRMEAKRRRLEKQRSSRVKMEMKLLGEENKALQGASSCGEAGSSGSTQSLQDQGNQEATYSSRSKISESFKTLGLEAETLHRTCDKVFFSLYR